MNNENEAQFFVDSEIFSIEIIMKTLFLFLDSCYVFLKKETDGLYIQLVKKESCEWSLQDIMGNISNELLNTLLMEKVTKENKKNREEIITRALWYSLCEAAIRDEMVDDSKLSSDIEDILNELDKEFVTIKS